jgi:hypothetical protein
MIGTPREYESVTIKPKTAAESMFSGLSAVILFRKTSSPTARPTARSALRPSVSPRFQPEGVVSVDQRAAVMTVRIISEKKVYVISLSLVIHEYSFGLDIVF